MNYGSLKTVFMQTMRRLQVPEVSLHDFGEAIDSAELFIAARLPQDSVSELILIKDYDVDPANPLRVTRPANMMKIESGRIASTRDASDNPIYIAANVVSQREFLAKADYSTEKLICEFNGYIGVNPSPAAEVVDAQGAVEVVFRKRPDGFMRNADSSRSGAFLTTLDTDSNPRILSTETLAVKLSSFGLDYSNLIGGLVIIPYSSSVIGKPVIDQVWDDDGDIFSLIHLSDDYTVPPSSGFTNCYIMESYIRIKSGEAFALDSDLPSLNEEFHSAMLDIAIGKFLMPFKPQEAGQYLGYAGQVLQAYGIDLATEYGGKE